MKRTYEVEVLNGLQTIYAQALEVRGRSLECEGYELQESVRGEFAILKRCRSLDRLSLEHDEFEYRVLLATPRGIFTCMYIVHKAADRDNLVPPKERALRIALEALFDESMKHWLERTPLSTDGP